MTIALPRRSKRYSIGKEIGGAVYVHRDYAEKLGDSIIGARKFLPQGFDYHVIKLDARTKAVSFIRCVDFDAAPEPTVGDIVTVNAEGNVRQRRQQRDPEIYHHKWLFVADDYKGFDVEASRQRSLAWMHLDGIDRRRIGKKSFWEEFVVPRLNGADALD